RLAELSLPDLIAYRRYLKSHAEEWRVFDAFCRIPLSRFYRDRAVFEALEREVLPALAGQAAIEKRNQLVCWSACCASGEEPYTLVALWRMRLQHRFPPLRLRVIATDIDAQLLERARLGCYGASSLKEMPPQWRDEFFTRRDGQFCVREEHRTVEFLEQDIRNVAPGEIFDLILCRNAVLTYFAPALQQTVMERVTSRLGPYGALVVGIHESLPEGLERLIPWPGVLTIYRMAPAFDAVDRSSTTSISAT
ncbi:MAG TPA: CheR family methyltransferase, partial [Burkholderiales bacterium]|nr:CheR family methyltransferase [Burkholderiales bacterium]